MVQQIETWSIVRGRVRAVADDPKRAGFRVVSLEVSGVEPLEGYASALAAAAAGTTVDVAVPRETAEGLALGAGDELELQARASPGGLFAHPDRVVRR